MSVRSRLVTLAQTTSHLGQFTTQRLNAASGGTYPRPNLVGATTGRAAGNNRDYQLAHLAQSGLVRAMSTRRNTSKSGRPPASSNVKLLPQFRNPLDIEKLGKALISIALHMAETDQPGDQTKDGHDELG